MLHGLIKAAQMFGKRVITGWHICYKTKGLIPTERVHLINACGSWYAIVNILIDFSPFCWTEPTPCIYILKRIRAESPSNIFPKFRTLAKHNRSGHSENSGYMLLLNQNWLTSSAVACLKIRFFSQSHLIISQSIHNVTKVCTDARRYGICLWN